MTWKKTIDEIYKGNTMETIIKVEVKRVYGNELVYPLNELARTLCKLTGRATFTSLDISILKGIGFIFEVKQKEL